MNNKTDAEYYNYLCELETNILCILCSRITKISYHIDILKTYVTKIKKVPKTCKLTYEKRSIMLEQLKGIIKAYELVYLYQNDDDSESSSRSGNGSSEEEFILPVSSNNFQKN